MSRTQAAAAGISRAAIRHALESQAWQELLPGVFAAFSGPVTETHRIRAAWLYGRGRALVTGNVTCRAAGLRYVPAEDGIMLLGPTGFRRKATGFVRVRRTTRMPSAQLWTPPASTPHERQRRTPISLAPTPRAVLDAALCVGLRTAQSIPRRANGTPLPRPPGVALVYGRALQDVRALVCEAVQRGKVSPAELVDELEHAPQQGSMLARRAIADAVAGCRSAPECELRDLVTSSDELPEARWNLPLPGQPNVIPDACWPEARLIVEVDSVQWHRYGDAPERTEQRRAMLASLGWTVYPVSPRRLRTEPPIVLAEIVAAYRAGLAR